MKIINFQASSGTGKFRTFSQNFSTVFGPGSLEKPGIWTRGGHGLIPCVFLRFWLGCELRGPGSCDFWIFV